MTEVITLLFVGAALIAVWVGMNEIKGKRR